MNITNLIGLTTLPRFVVGKAARAAGTVAVSPTNFDDALIKIWS